jgi:2'-5' RNA ligase
MKAKRVPKQRPPAENVDTAWRIFLAVPLPPDVVAMVDRVVRDLKREEWPIRWTTGSNAHITLQFLGDVAPERVELLRLGLGPVVGEHRHFRLRTADLGVFPNWRRPRVLWLGLYGPAHRLQTLHDAIGAYLIGFDFQLDEKEFHPHITLGRVRDVRNAPSGDLPQRIRQRFERATETGEVSHQQPLPVPVDEVHLIRSHLSHEGSRYEVLARFLLSGRQSDDAKEALEFGE